MTFGTAMLILGFASIGSILFMYYAENLVRKELPQTKDWEPTEYQLPQNQYLQPGTMILNQDTGKSSLFEEMKERHKNRELKDFNEEEEEDYIEKMLREARSRE